jgi:hypothetical protein
VEKKGARTISSQPAAPSNSVMKLLKAFSVKASLTKSADSSSG